MAKKEKTVLKFVERNNTLYAVTGMPKRTTAPQETAHYICYCSSNNKRYKMKINTCTFGAIVVVDENGEPKRKPRLWKATKKRLGDVQMPEREVIYTKDKQKVVSTTPNFKDVTGTRLKELWEKSSPSFKRDFLMGNH